MTERKEKLEPVKKASWDSIATSLGIQLRRLHELRANPDSPQTRDVEGWRAYLKAIGHRHGPAVEDRSAILTQLRQEELTAAKLKNQRDEASIDRLAQVAAETVLDAMLVRVRASLLGQLPAALAAALKGQPAVEGEIIARKLIEAALHAAKGTP